MGERWFTSDLHAGHVYMARLRGFASPEQHDAELERRWNARVHPDDLVFVAGDVALGARRETLKLYERLHGTKILIPGNHDNVWPGNRNSWQHEALYRQYFAHIQAFARIRIGNHCALISHFPYAADSTDQPRYMTYRLRDTSPDHWLLHGHTHRNHRMTSAREIHIGMDAWDLYPVRESDILELITMQLQREGKDPGENVLPVAGTPEAAGAD